MKGLVFHIVLLLFLICQIQITLYCQESLYKFDDEIKNISINEDGRLQILSSKNLCALEGNQLVDACIKLPEEVSFVLPIKDDFLVLASGNILHFIREQDFVHSDSLPELITGIIQLDSILLIGTAGKGLYQYGLNTYEQKFIGFENQYINDLCKLNDQICLALDDGIAVYNVIDGKIRHQKLNDIISFTEPFNNAKFIAASESGNLYILDLNSNLEIQKSIKDLKIKALSSSLDRAFILTDNECFQIDSGLEVWPFSKGEYSSILALPNILLLSEGNNLLFFDINYQSFQTSYPVYSVFSIQENDFWIGTEGAVEHWVNNSPVASISIPTKVKHISVSALLVKNNMVFAGTLGDGLFVFNLSGQMIKHILSQEENNKNNIIQLSGEGNLIWIAYLNGLLTLDPEKLTTVKDYGQLLGNNYLYCFLPINQDKFYIGTSSKGLLKYDMGEISYLLPKSSVLSIFSNEDSLFFATENKGLFLLEKDDSISRLADANNIQSITLFNECLFYAREGENMIMDLHSKLKYPIGNGDLKGIQLNSIAQSNASLLLGYENGLLKLNKGSLEKLKNFGLHLNTPRLFNKKIKPGQNKFKYSENAFTFTFHPNIYSGTSNTIYKYRLLGLDTSWQSTQQNKISYYNLNPGKYEYQVGGGLQTNFDKENIQRFAFQIAEPFWASWWFLSLLGTLILISLYFYIKWRERNIINKQKQEQQRIIFEFEQLKNQIDPHFLFNSLNSLIGLIEENPESAARSTEKLSQLYRNILKFEKTELIPLRTELELARDYFEIHKLRYENLIDLKIDIPENIEGMIIPMSCQFLIENAIKHNIIDSQHHLEINMNYSDGYLEISNSKNKKQIANNKKSGIGLANLKARYKFITEKPVFINETENTFIVKIPILHD